MINKIKELVIDKPMKVGELDNKLDSIGFGGFIHYIDYMDDFLEECQIYVSDGYEDYYMTFEVVERDNEIVKVVSVD